MDQCREAEEWRNGLVFGGEGLIDSGSLDVGDGEDALNGSIPASDSRMAFYHGFGTKDKLGAQGADGAVIASSAPGYVFLSRQ